MRVVIEAELESGREGGLEHYLVTLASGLSASAAAGSEATFVVGATGDDWLAPGRGAAIGTVQPANGRGPKGAVAAAREFLGRRTPVGPLWRSVRRHAGFEKPPTTQPTFPLSDGFYESLQPDVVHFPYIGRARQSAVPMAVTVHDLQHRHFPEFFQADHLAWREAAFPAVMGRADLVLADSEWVRDDIVAQYGIPASKVEVAHLASGLSLLAKPDDASLAATRRALDLPERFALYPAMPYRHKNHLRLLEAIAALRSRGVRVEVVCPGQQLLAWPEVRERLNTLGLADQVRFVGFVSPARLRALYALASFLVFPSLFEGAGLPVLEAMDAGLAVACSDLPPLREYAGTAARFFDPVDVDAIADAVASLWQDAGERADRARQGLEQSARWSLDAMGARHWQLYGTVLARAGTTGHDSLARKEA